MARYDASFRPPAPVADVILIHPVTKISTAQLMGKIDSGAGITVIPYSAVAILNLNPKGQTWTRGYDGIYTLQKVYYVALSLEGKFLPSVRVISANRSNVLLGRNVINRFSINLNGKAQQVAIR
jgi:predicted aspartyl protease